MLTFTDFFPTLPTINRKFLITDFWLLSTSIKPKNFIDFYRSQKKMKHPQCLPWKVGQWVEPGNTKGGSITVPLTSCLTGLDKCFANKNKNCQLSYSWFQTSQTGGQRYSDTSSFSIPWLNNQLVILFLRVQIHPPLPEIQTSQKRKKFFLLTKAALVSFHGPSWHKSKQAFITFPTAIRSSDLSAASWGRWGMPESGSRVAALIGLV